jgi:MSHA type pilus biogenesis protein MshL
MNAPTCALSFSPCGAANRWLFAVFFAGQLALGRGAELQSPTAVPVPSLPPPGLAEQQMAGKQLFSFRAQDVELKTALALFARANRLNVIPDHDVSGRVTIDIQNLPLTNALSALLLASDCAWSQQGELILVQAAETKLFRLNYLRLTRKGTGSSSATLASGAGSGGGGGGGAGAAGAGGGGQGGSAINLQQDNFVDFWKELREELMQLLTERGKQTLAINMTAGIIQVTDRPTALRRVASYLEGMEKTVHRQVNIEAKLYDVILNDQFQLGVDWQHAAQTYGGKLTVAGAPSLLTAGGGFDLKPSAFSAGFQNDNTKVLLQALKEQGEVRVISKPSIRTLNNQTALIKVGAETPFFTRNSVFLPGSTSGSTTTIQEDQVTTVTVGTVLAITPQIAPDDWITLDISPVLTSLVETRLSPSRTTTAPVLDIKQASTLIRVRSGETIVMGGLIQNETSEINRKVPLIGDIPLLGKLFQGRVNSSRRRELVMFITAQLVD